MINERPLRIAAAVTVALVAAWAGGRLYTLRAAPPPVDRMRIPVGEASPPTASDGLSADFPGPLQPTIPDRLPEFTLADRAGKDTPVSTWHDKSLVINFWATWCAPCRREIPLLESLSTAWADRNVQMIGIAVDHRKDVLAYADEMHIPYPLLIGEQDAMDVAAAFGFDAPAFPFTIFTDRRGEVVTLFVGELHQPQADLILSVVQNLNQQRVKLPEARRNIEQGLRALRKDQPG